MKRTVDVYDLGRMSYRDAWDLQKKTQKLLVVQKQSNREGNPVLNDHLYFTEHPHVYTLGKSGKASNLLRSSSELSKIDAEYIEIDRGGDITYHGPGQVVGYPILDLENYFTDIHKYLRYLEEVIIQTCLDFEIRAGRIDGLTGVWVDGEKVCAMGIRCSRWVTMHGFALNVDTDLNYFENIIPCGIEGKRVTSLSKILGMDVESADVKKRIVSHFQEIFDADLQWKNEKPELSTEIN